MYYSVTFTDLNGGKKNTWEDWRLIPSSPPMVAPPEPYTNYVEIPGRKKGPLDLSEVLTGEPTFNNSEGSWNFILSDDETPRPEQIRAIRKFIHGKRLTIQLEEDPDCYWQGRFTVSETQIGKSYSGITINYVIDPVEYENEAQTNLDNIFNS